MSKQYNFDIKIKTLYRKYLKQFIIFLNNNIIIYDYYYPARWNRKKIL